MASSQKHDATTCHHMYSSNICPCQLLTPWQAPSIMNHFSPAHPSSGTLQLYHHNSCPLLATDVIAKQYRKFCLWLRRDIQKVMEPTFQDFVDRIVGFSVPTDPSATSLVDACLTHSFRLWIKTKQAIFARCSAIVKARCRDKKLFFLSHFVPRCND